jgi:hypothetical protein
VPFSDRLFVCLSACPSIPCCPSVGQLSVSVRPGDCSCIGQPVRVSVRPDNCPSVIQPVRVVVRVDNCLSVNQHFGLCQQARQHLPAHSRLQSPKPHARR